MSALLLSHTLCVFYVFVNLRALSSVRLTISRCVHSSRELFPCVMNHWNANNPPTPPHIHLAMPSPKNHVLTLLGYKYLSIIFLQSEFFIKGTAFYSSRHTLIWSTEAHEYTSSDKLPEVEHPPPTNQPSLIWKCGSQILEVDLLFSFGGEPGSQGKQCMSSVYTSRNEKLHWK